MTEDLFSKLQETDTRAIAKAITLIESSRRDDRKQAIDLLTKLKAGANQNSIRIGISGIPGVGKSTFIESMGSHILQDNPELRIAILTIDPSSPLEGGSILADRLRMKKLSKHPNVFIRPSPSSGIHGGLSRRTRETMLLLEAVGFDLIIVETVGVGQAEFHVSSLVDLFLLLQMPSTGDEWQAMKKGILELADMIVVNKADGELINEAKRLEKILRLSFGSSTDHESSQIVSCSSLLHTGISEIWKNIFSSIQRRKTDKSFFEKRKKQTLFWFEEELLAQFKYETEFHPKIVKILNKIRKDLKENNTLLFPVAARTALNQLLKKEFQI